MGRSKEQVAEIILAWKRAGLPLPMCWEANVSHSLSCARMHLEHREMSHSVIHNLPTQVQKSIHCTKFPVPKSRKNCKHCNTAYVSNSSTFNS